MALQDKTIGVFLLLLFLTLPELLLLCLIRVSNPVIKNFTGYG